MSSKSPFRRFSFFAVSITVLFLAGRVSAQMHPPPNDTVLHVFAELNLDGATDGSVPAGGVVFDKQGNLYGATQSGGASRCSPLGECGIIYQLVPTQSGPWTENILHVFLGVPTGDGALPSGGLIMDQAGNLYGVTAYGGTGGCIVLGIHGACGTVFELSPPAHQGGAWTESVLYSFKGGNDGYLPVNDLTFDDSGNLYGSTTYGGGFGSCNAPYYQFCGTVFELSRPTKPGGAWTEKILYSFKSGADGANPYGNLVFASHGSLFGTTQFGGNQLCSADAGIGCGTVFELQPPSTHGGTWTESVLYTFQNTPDGATPGVGLAVGADGVLYGATQVGGMDAQGALFSLSPPGISGGPWTESIIQNFGGRVGGGLPTSGPILRGGFLYGTASEDGAYSVGTIYRLSLPASPGAPGTPGTYTVICEFATGDQAEGPYWQLTMDSTGAFYSTTLSYNHVSGGSVYRLAN